MTETNNNLKKKKDVQVTSFYTMAEYQFTRKEEESS